MPSLRGEIVAVLFFPNNYSGSEDRNGVVDPVDYLMFGVGTQKQLVDLSSDEERREPILTDIPPTSVNKSDCKGYEMGKGGISKVSSSETLDKQSDIEKRESTIKWKQKELLTASNCEPITVNASTPYGNKAVLAKMVGKTTNPMNDKRYFDARWYYRVDAIDEGYEGYRDVMSQKLSDAHNYIDGADFRLNSSIDSNLDKVISRLGIESGETTTFISFSDLYKALVKDTDKNSRVEANSNKNVQLVQDILDGKGKNVYLIDIKGFASNHDTSETKEKARNTRLASARAETIRQFLKKYNFPQAVGAIVSSTNIQDRTRSRQIII